MSEYINNQTQRQEALKRVIRQLHEGKSVEEVKGEFAALLRDVGASEIAALEQALIDEGLPETEVKRLCDVHVAVFRESLEARRKPDTIPGHPVYTFLAENGAAGRVLDALQEALQALKAAPDAQRLAQARQRLQEMRQYEKHYLRKENILFPYLEKHGFSGPSAVMWAIHDDIRAGWKALDALLAAGPGDDPASFNARLDEVFVPLSTAIREMFYKEENILFPTALEMLSEEEWLEVRRHEPEIGTCYVEPGSQWPPQMAAAEAAPLPAEARAVTGDLLHLDTGSLTASEINRLLTHLPVDITYVDKEDTVRFFSQTRERIFPRSPAIIGRKVQKCHPPASLHRVQQILDDFRAGRRDEAEFWIQMRGRFIHIRYFAVRDEQGQYQGTLEVTQDITRLRTLEGERRLLDEDR
ncbi:MAG: DUF438 domain-containing protein [Anaerolineae bacterium]|nr:DUF438 domain-containing protein [Anaerolineae bacterium]